MVDIAKKTQNWENYFSSIKVKLLNIKILIAKIK